PKIAVMEHSFHGRTLAALAATGNAAIQQGFEPLLGGFVRVPHGDIDALKRVAADEDIVAVLLEPVQGEGGVRPAPTGYLAGVRALCDQQDWLMMVDEVQTGIARTGRWFGFQHEANVLPEQGLLINVTAGSVVRLLPPLILTESQAELIADRVIGVIRDWYAAH
ncbi:MAG: aminotransferase class III-fold pyridoxal phosphate-dependent enzyme, partial [Gammaproteobacteria bacterium]